MKDFLRLIRFDRPIGTLLLLWPTLWALFIAGHGHPPITITLVFVVGVFLTRSAGCVINDYADIEYDRHVLRTKNRPLVTNQISKKQALLICVSLSIAAFILAWIFLRQDTLLLSIPALILFVSYPFTKRFFAFPQMYLSVAFSFGILMVFMELNSSISLDAYLLFFANCCWVFGYDTIYALCDLEDDKKIGIKTSAITLGRYVIPAIAISYILFMSLMAILAYCLDFTGYFWILWCIALIILTYEVWVISRPNKEAWFKMFLINNKVGYILFVAIILGR